MKLITIEELMKRLSIGRNTAYKLLEFGELKAFKIGKVWKISEKSVELYIKEKNIRKAVTKIKTAQEPITPEPITSGCCFSVLNV